MVYDDLTNDALLEIGIYLDPKSICAWSQTSRRHYALLLQSKHILLNLAKSWDFNVPLGLPVHQTLESLATAELNKAMRRALALDLAWERNGFAVAKIGSQPLNIRDDFPGCIVDKVHYMHGLRLALVSIQDGHFNTVRYIALYQISPPRKVGAWMTEHGHITCWTHRWVDSGMGLKQLVVAVCVIQPGWHDLETRNSMEVYKIDVEQYVSNQAPVAFEPMGKCCWSRHFTYVTLSDHTAGAVVLSDGNAVVICCLDWRTGVAENILVDAKDNHQLTTVEDYAGDIDFGSTRQTRLFHVKEWIGLIRFSGVFRCLLLPMRVGHPTYHPHGLSSYAPFRVKTSSIAIGVNEPASAANIGYLSGGQVAMMPSILHDGEKMLFVEMEYRGPAHNVCMVDFQSLIAKHPGDFSPGFHRIPAPKTYYLRDVPEPKLGCFGHVVAHVDPSDIDRLLLHQMPFSYYGSRCEERVVELDLPTNHHSFVAMDDAAGVICVKHVWTEGLTFYRLE